MQYFDAIRRAGSIREAARRLNVASSAVNRQLLKLEEEVGAPLFERVAGGVRLTAAGEALARHVIMVLQDFERAKGDIEGLRGARTGHVSIVTVEGLCGSFLPEALERLHRRAPRITVGASTRGSAAIADAVSSGEADIGIAFDLPRHAELRQVAVARFRLGLVATPDHPLAGRASVGLSDCMGHTLLLPDPSLSTHRYLSALLAETRGAAVPAFVHSSSIELMREMAERGTGIAFQTRLGLEGPLRRGTLVHVPLVRRGEPLWSELGIYVRAGRALPPAVDLGLGEIADHLLRTAENAGG